MTDQHDGSDDEADAAAEAWRHRVESDRQWDLTVLGVTAGSRVRIDRRGGDSVEGIVREHPDGHGFWSPTVGPGDVIYLDPGSRQVQVSDIEAIVALPDEDYTHDSDRHGEY